LLTGLEIIDPTKEIESLDKINLLLNCIFAKIPAISDEYNPSSLQGVKLKDTLKGKFINDHIFEFFEKVINSDLLFEYSFQLWIEIIETEINKNCENKKVNISKLPEEVLQKLKTKIHECIEKMDYNNDFNKVVIENSLNYYNNKSIVQEKVQGIIDLFVNEKIIDQSTIISIPLQAFRIDLIHLTFFYKLKNILNYLTIELEKQAINSEFYDCIPKGYLELNFDIFNSFIKNDLFTKYNEFASNLDYYNFDSTDFTKNIRKLNDNSPLHDKKITNAGRAYIASKKEILENLDTELVYKQFEASCKKLNKLIKGIPDLIIVQFNNDVIQTGNYFVLLNFLLEIKNGFHNQLFTESKIKEIENKYNENILQPVIEFVKQQDLIIKLFINDIFQYIKILLINQNDGNKIKDTLFQENKNYNELLDKNKGIFFSEMYLCMKKMINHNGINVQMEYQIFQYLNCFLANNNIALLDLNDDFNVVLQNIRIYCNNYLDLYKIISNKGNIDTVQLKICLSNRIANVNGLSKPSYNKKTIDHVVKSQIPQVLDALKTIVKY
ncbi:MAG: hypothetical protein V3575_02930, partial [Candidatus Absconditabacteria bacterium]